MQQQAPVLQLRELVSYSCAADAVGLQRLTGLTSLTALKLGYLYEDDGGFEEVTWTPGRNSACVW